MKFTSVAYARKERVLYYLRQLIDNKQIIDVDCCPKLCECYNMDAINYKELEPYYNENIMAKKSYE